jgi:hypothetical protein
VRRVWPLTSQVAFRSQVSGVVFNIGGGSSPRSLSQTPALGARPRGGCRLPDAILHGKRSHRPRSRAVQGVAAAGLLSEASKPDSTGGCATGLRTWARHVCDLRSASRPFCAGTATAFDRALAPCDGSDLLTLRLPFAHKSAVSFLTSPTFRKVFTNPAEISCPPQSERSLCPAFQRLSFG